MSGAVNTYWTNDPDVGLAGDLVEARFGMSTDLVNQYSTQSSSAIDSLAGYSFAVPLENIDLESLTAVEHPNIGDAPAPDPVDPYVSQLQEITFPDLEALRASLELVEVTLGTVILPVLEAKPPVVELPPPPDDIMPSVPDDVPVPEEVTLPPPVTIDLPPVPVLEETVLPPVPVLENITFDAVLPTADLTPPEPMFIYDEATYQSDLADALKTKLYNDITLGGTGLDAEVEQAIWDRALSRLNIELDKTNQQVLTNWETWNQEMPDGVLSGALQEVAFENSRTLLDLDRDILKQQADLAQENTHFAITSGLVYEKQIMDFTNQANQRAFEVARYRVQAVIDAFNVKVLSFNAQMDGYKTQAQVFESRIRAEIATVELYKAQMEGAKIHGDLQAQKIEIYTARVDALNTLISLYQAQMEGARLQIEVDKAKVDVFRAQVDAVVAQIGGITAKYDLYQAKITGELSKVELYGRQVDAFATQVNASKIEADINLSEAQAKIESNKDKISVLTAAIDKYKADTDYEIGKEDVGARVYTAQVGGYEAEVGREESYIRAQVDSYRAQVSEVMARAELIIKELDANLRAATASQEIAMEALKAAANVQSQRIASALSSVSASAQIGFNGSISDAYSRQEASSENFSIQHNWNH